MKSKSKRSFMTPIRTGKTHRSKRLNSRMTAETLSTRATKNSETTTKTKWHLKRVRKLAP